MRPSEPSDPEHIFNNVHDTVGVIGLEKPHNEKPIGKYSVEYLIQWLEAIQQFQDEVYLWQMDQEDGSNFAMVATPSKESRAGYTVCSRIEVNEE